MELLSPAEIDVARANGAGVVLTTPVLPSTTFSRMCGHDIWLKCENLQRAGSFKIRGAMNALAHLDEAHRSAGVVAASAGNHAQGVALAASSLGIDSTVFMPESAPIPKIDATRSYGATVELAGADLGESVDAALAHADATGATFVHPYDDRHIVAGQATLGLELVEQVPDMETVVIPIGGGGLAAGAAAAIKRARPDVTIVGVEAAATPTYRASRDAGVPTDVEPRFTLADGIAVARASHLVYEHLEAFVDDLVTVGDAEMTRSVALLLERAKLLVEASGAAPLAAALSGAVPADAGRTVLVLSGGNVDLLLLDQVLRHGLEAAGRYEAFAVRVPDVPGQLNRVTTTIAAAGANVVAVDHGRQGIGLPFGYTEIRFEVETRSAEHYRALCDRLATEGFDVID
jgi:threonine dehydratase